MSTPNWMAVLVCGGRDYSDRVALKHSLDTLREQIQNCDREILVLHGCARGADSLAKEWALNNGLAQMGIEAAWDFYDKRAGFIRNAWLRDIGKPEYCVAFPGGRGTASMVSLCKGIPIPVWEVSS